jgi:tight adherence protein C
VQLEYSIPVIIAVIAFLTADENNHLFANVLQRSFDFPGRESIEVRLAQLGRTKPENYENFRIVQLAYLTGALTIPLVLLVLAVISSVSFFLISMIICFLVLVLTERSLSKKCLLRKSEIEDEFPALVEMLTLSVGAGESPAAALKRITTRAEGHLVKEFRDLVKDVELGVPFTSALDAMSNRVQSENLRRFVDSLIISISRGTPLVETLAHSAQEARNREKIKLLDSAGRSEISMMIPVVFLILPVSILFALFPSLTNLNLFTGQ